MQNITARFIKDESGATAIEYGLLAAVLGVAVIAAGGALGGKLTSSFNTLGESVGTKAEEITSD